MANFSVTHLLATAAANTTVISLGGAAAARPMVSFFSIGCPSTPNNLAGEFTLKRWTVAPTGGTTLIPESIDVAGSATLCFPRGGTMTEPTYVAGAGQEYWGSGLNQQATFQWWANPGFEPRTAVGTANGIGLRIIAHGGTPSVKGSAMWSE